MHDAGRNNDARRVPNAHVQHPAMPVRGRIGAGIPEIHAEGAAEEQEKIGLLGVLVRPARDAGMR